MPDKPVLHARDHRPGGTDVSWAGIWHLVGGSDLFAPIATAPSGYMVDFVNGNNMSPTTAIPKPVPMQFRMAVGPINVLTYNHFTSPPMATGIEWYTDHQIEIQGDVANVSPGDIVFVLPIEYTHDHDVPCHSHDDSGNYVPCRLYSDGRFVYGVP